MSIRDDIYTNLRHQQREKLLTGADLINCGVRTIDIADALSLNRANVSRELNRLCEAGLIIKTEKRPVNFYDRTLLENQYDIDLQKSSYESPEDIFSTSLSMATTAEKEPFTSLIGSQGSLLPAIESAKAAIIYPPKGLTTLITGDSGVGKSLFAEEMHRFAISSGVIDENAPFVFFNCADFADNQQLLLSHLFGFKKGSFTGAIHDEKGLVEVANNGILFLDEVHRLSHQGQEMLFYLMDKGAYKQLGETAHTHHVNLRLIMATTENPTGIMLDTFLRRIPVRISLPPLHQRPTAEKVTFVGNFFKQESESTGQDIVVPKDILTTLMNHHYAGNVGQLRSDIKCMCAQAYLRTSTQRKECITVAMDDAPSHIARDLLDQNAEGLHINFLPESFNFSPTTSVKSYIDLFDTLSAYQELCNKLFDRTQTTNISDMKEDTMLPLVYEYASNLVLSYDLSRHLAEIRKHQKYLQSIQSLLKERQIQTDDTDFIARILLAHLLILAKSSGRRQPSPLSTLEYYRDSNNPYDNMTADLMTQIAQPMNITISTLDAFIIHLLLKALKLHFGTHKNRILLAMADDVTAHRIATIVNNETGWETIEVMDNAVNATTNEVVLTLRQKISETALGVDVIVMTDLAHLSTILSSGTIEERRSLRVIDRADLPSVGYVAQLISSSYLSLNSLSKILDDRIGAAPTITIAKQSFMKNGDH